MLVTANTESREKFVSQMEKYNALYEQSALDPTLFTFFVADYLVSSKDVDALEIVPVWINSKLDELVEVYKRDGELTLSGSHGVTDKSDLGRELTELLNK
jgi:hypothetical protein